MRILYTYPLTYEQIARIGNVLSDVELHVGQLVSLHLTIGSRKLHLQWGTTGQDRDLWPPPMYDRYSKELELREALQRTIDWRSGSPTYCDVSEEEFDEDIRPVLDLALLAS